MRGKGRNVCEIYFSIFYNVLSRNIESFSGPKSFHFVFKGGQGSKPPCRPKLTGQWAKTSPAAVRSLQSNIVLAGFELLTKNTKVCESWVCEYSSTSNELIFTIHYLLDSLPFFLTNTCNDFSHFTEIVLRGANKTFFTVEVRLLDLLGRLSRPPISR